MLPGLSIVAVPIGNYADITLRAVEALRTCDEIICEDTRVTQKLLLKHAIQGKKLYSYHDHNAESMRPKVIEKLREGKALCLVSDAGTPLISDPGYKLIKACRAYSIPLQVLPGPSSVLAALVLSGLPAQPFLFAGFAEPKNLMIWKDVPATLVFFESATRLVACLEQMAAVFSNRAVAVVREITKTFEEVKHGSFADVIDFYKANTPRGEIVIVVGPPCKNEAVDFREELQKALQTYSVKDACTLIAQKYGIQRKIVYTAALSLDEK